MFISVHITLCARDPQGLSFALLLLVGWGYRAYRVMSPQKLIIYKLDNSLMFQTGKTYMPK
jgi:hypothetical protein